MPISLDQFVENLTSTGLMSAEEVSTICDSLPEDMQPADAEGLAAAGIPSEYLTPVRSLSRYSIPPFARLSRDK